MINLSDIEAAAATIRDSVHRTPVFSSTQIGKRVGTDLWLKAELLQKTGSFKARGALNRLRNTPQADLDKGLVTISAGNHAQALAWAASQVGAKATVVMPANASRTKAAAARGYGAEVVLHGDMEGAFAKMRELEDSGKTLIHPFNDPLVIAGQGTSGLELIEDHPELDLVVVPIGGGGLISGVSTAVKGLSPSTRVIGVEPLGAPSMTAAWAAGGPVDVTLDTIADGLAAPFAGDNTFAITRERVDEIVLVTEEELKSGMAALYSFAKLFAEPAGAAGIAALLAGKIEVGRHTGVIISGGNFEVSQLAGLGLGDHWA